MALSEGAIIFFFLDAAKITCARVGLYRLRAMTFGSMPEEKLLPVRALEGQGT
jgi:hypothetical protein